MKRVLSQVYAALALVFTVFCMPAFAQAGQPLGLFFFPESVTPVAKMTDDFNLLVNIILLLIFAFVFVLLMYVCVRYRRSANPVASKFSHNTMVEVVWTVIPVLILVVIAVPSFQLLYKQDQVPEEYDLTVKAIGYQWKWGYAYDDHDVDEYISNMLSEAQLLPAIRDELTARAGPNPERDLINDQAKAIIGSEYPDVAQQRARVLELYGHAPDTYRLAVDNPVVAPAGATVRVQVTAYDVIHNWAMPSFAIKTDAIPGRTNETHFTVPESEVGTYYGQCSELCGIKHAFMPITVEIVPQNVFDAWIEAAAEFGGDSAEARQVIMDYKGVGGFGRDQRVAMNDGATTSPVSEDS